MGPLQNTTRHFGSETLEDMAISNELSSENCCRILAETKTPAGFAQA
jgi:hypothetical protein